MAAKLGGSGGDKHTIEQQADINITPFIDILLVLMIIFMVAAPMATVSIKLDLPPAQPPANPEKEKEPVYITIQENGQIFIADKQSSIDNLPVDVCSALGGGACREERVFVRAQPEVKYRQFMEVMNKMQENGFFKVGLLNEDIT
ncbi:biopolymer transporter ExbD [Brevundimonas sp. SORGH_AS_0993]|uniref:biopolymer transporter ExbD n=1 Tax=Brevundimonas sp. SORGH_AS_0993 TaxID=3041794 RepID=UPI00278B9F29|nr:biopolymer transporter ExbD [Brevundimonas sp. SORGH_AS_0993]MDQ1152907.1 biopolymer transport protein ExbD [Brevundimonas sp. SORGH_AS_0993]